MQCFELEVTKASDRLDAWLAENLPNLSRSRLQKLIAEGYIEVNGEICPQKKAKLKHGDRIQVTIPDSTPLELQPQAIPLDILYEDEHLIIINKQAGLVVHPAAGHADGTLVNALLAHCSNLAGIGGVQRPGIVHRLDKDTTGAMMVAKTARREYLGVVYGSPKDDSGAIDLPIGRHLGDRQKMAVIPETKGGRPSITHWRVEERIGNYTLMHFQLETGRTHQIRVHMAHLNHPIVGDPVYSSNRSVGVNLSGQALHAWRLTLEHPVSGEIIAAIAPLPSELTKLIDILKRRHQG
jgi:23S rRNA pseudouridine1911/1915/1917 synthase